MRAVLLVLQTPTITSGVNATFLGTVFQSYVEEVNPGLP
jgi:hypothetical protein